jgi:hypothetical protein
MTETYGIGKEFNLEKALKKTPSIYQNQIK